MSVEWVRPCGTTRRPFAARVSCAIRSLGSVKRDEIFGGYELHLAAVFFTRLASLAHLFVVGSSRFLTTLSTAHHVTRRECATLTSRVFTNKCLVLILHCNHSSWRSREVPIVTTLTLSTYSLSHNTIESVEIDRLFSSQTDKYLDFCNI